MRRQLAAYSPLAPRALLAAAGAALRPGRGGADRLLALLAARHGAASGLLCGSGTQALQIAISAAHAAAGDASVPVALPAYTCFDVAAAAVGADVPIAPYDIDPVTLSPDLDSLDRVLAAGARVLVAAWAYGHPPAWREVLAIAGKHGARVIEDAAQGHGAAWRGRAAGGFGALSVLSFGRGKGWTGGRGGALLARAAEIEIPAVPSSGSIPEIANVAVAAAQWVLGRPSLYALPAALPGLALGETVYHPPRAPRALSRTAATLLRRTRAAAEREADARRRNARALLDAISGILGVRRVDPVDGAEPGYLRLPVLLDRPLPASAARLGVIRGYPTPLAALDAVRPRLAGPERRWPGAEELVARLVTLPTHSLLSPRDLRAIVSMLHDHAAPPIPRAADDRRAVDAEPGKPAVYA